MGKDNKMPKRSPLFLEKDYGKIDNPMDQKERSKSFTF
jgi:hypothetical protein